MIHLQLRKLLFTPPEATTLLVAECSVYQGGLCIYQLGLLTLSAPWLGALSAKEKCKKKMAAVTTHSKFYYWYIHFLTTSQHLPPNHVF